MAQVISTILDTDDLETYVRDNLDMWDLDVDEDGNAYPDEFVEKVVAEVVKRSTDGKLRNEIAECFDTWLGSKFGDMIYECVNDFVGDVVCDMLNKMEG